MADLTFTIGTYVSNTGKAWTKFRVNHSRQRKVTRSIHRRVARGCKQSAEFLLEKSREIVPILSKDLYNSSRVTGEGNIDKGNKTYAVVYDQEYAAIQHETPPPIYTHEPGKSYKYLEKPARIYRRVMANIIRDEAIKE